MDRIKIGLSGANGKMGFAVRESMKKELDRFTLSATLDSKSSESDIVNFTNRSDLIIDFSHPTALKKLINSVKRSNIPLLVGTTGLKSDHFQDLKDLSNYVAVLYAPNTSLGANLIASLAAQSAKILKKYDIEIIEAHHRYKKDAPSGTALMIGKKIAKSTNIDFEKNAVFSRINSPKKAGDIGFSSIRGGGIFGKNKVLFADDHELITISCSALSRSAFSDGALFAANWLFNQKPGLYSMEDVLSLNGL